MSTGTGKLGGPVWIEALRLARLAIKDAIRLKHGKISDYKRSDITRAAIQLMNEEESIIAQAKLNTKVLRKRKRK